MRARLHRHVKGRAASEPPGNVQSDDLAVSTRRWLRPSLPHDLVASDNHRTDDGVRVRRSAPSLGELERALHAHVSACTSRRYARGRSSCPKIDDPATNNVAPASWISRMFSGPIPPST